VNTEWLKAAGIVLGGAVVLGALGYYLEHPYLGVAAGVAVGMTINYQRQCPVCAAHLAAMRAATGG
jgi:hypothetical protein